MVGYDQPPNLTIKIPKSPVVSLTIGGSYVYRSSTYAAQRALAFEAVKTGKALKIGGNVQGGVGIGLTLYDMKVNGINASNTLDAAVGAASFIPGVGWIIGSVYFVSNAYMQATTGESIAEHWQNESQRVAESYQCPLNHGLD